jgi:hypothetical protein
MSTQRPQRHDSIASDRGTDPRPNYIHTGTDEDGADHIYCTIDERVIVVDAQGDREHVEHLNGRSIHEWMTFVATKRGWSSQYLVESFGDFLENTVDNGGEH